MNVRSSIRLMAALALLALGACATTPKSSKPEPAWINNMHRLSAAHLRLMPVVSDGKKFADPQNKGGVTEELREFANAASTIANDSKAPNADPIISFNAVNLANDAKQAFAAYQMGDMQWSRFAFNRASSYCIGCHTRADRGAKDFEMGWTTELSGLNPAQHVEYLMANRRYKSALTQASLLAADTQFVQRDPRTWVLTIERALGLLVRVYKDPVQAAQLVQSAVANRSAPYYLRRDASSWLADIRQWQKDAMKTKASTSLKGAIKLVEYAQKAGPRSSSSLIPYLRASGILHELLEDSRSNGYGEVLLYSGMVADSLRDLNLGFLDQFYYEKCILHEPHSELAENCYSRLELSVRDSNPFLDLDPNGEYAIRSRLSELRKLAEVKNVLDDPKWMHRPWEDQFDNNSDRGPRKGL